LPELLKRLDRVERRLATENKPDGANGSQE
jgi:hypothetical protein